MAPIARQGSTPASNSGSGSCRRGRRGAVLPPPLLATGIPPQHGEGLARASKGVPMALNSFSGVSRFSLFPGCPGFPYPSSAALLLGTSHELLPTCTTQPSPVHPRRMLQSCMTGSEQVTDLERRQEEDSKRCCRPRSISGFTVPALTHQSLRSYVESWTGIRGLAVSGGSGRKSLGGPD